ncbi:uncharacterized protein HKW66_Vig0001150 [Vigna angularis]|uniref:Protein ENHANCED DISEASE RESISTANCE 2 C-terminal domain-containing protein n=1 Tax=Phaseolus angularis TaxID=3914 RepID=A0A8T0L9F8_PHAAN|nr:uncharacterized protein HKW66_Vig0001150 [Vigna angularis]
MGTCMSKTDACAGGMLNFCKKKTMKKRDELRKRVSYQLSNGSLNKVDNMPEPEPETQPRSFSKPISQDGIVEEAWFDSVALFDSECDDDYQSVLDDFISLNGTESNRGVLKDQMHEPGELSKEHSAHDSEGVKNPQTESCDVDIMDSKFKQEGSVNEAQEPVFLDEFSIVNEHSKRDDEDLDDCGILPNNCLSCLASIDQRSLCSSPNTRKRDPTKHSSKWNGNATLPSSKTILLRPLAGYQVPFCPIEKRILDSWSQIGPCTFKVRGPNYLKDKKKEFASNYSAYYPFGVDVFLSPRKIDHIARFVELPQASPFGKLPPLLVVNVQIPVYPPSLFQGETDGEGMSFVMYFKLSESYSKDLPLMDDEVETVKTFLGDAIVPFSERLKILGRIVNPEDLHLSAPERKLLQSYNEKPFLSRPQHEFYTGNKAEELPEQVLCCIRLNCIDYLNYPQLGLTEDSL